MNPLDAALLFTLRASTVHLPSGDLAAQVRSTQSEVAARIEELRAAGFEIDERPGLGYRLIADRHGLAIERLEAQASVCPLFRKVLLLSETTSTNDHVGQLGRRGEPSGLVVFAERQTAGRGRFGRKWESASHLGIWFSMLLRPNVPLAHWPRLTTWVAVAVAEAIEDISKVPSRIKWPNDVYLDGRKVAGVLIETGVDEQGALFAVVGIGVNANHRTEDFPEELLSKATSLQEATGNQVDRTALAMALLKRLDQRYQQLESSFPELVAEATRRSMLLGQWVQVRAGESIIDGNAEGLDGSGQLLLRAADGTLHTLNAGEVSVILPPNTTHRYC